MKNIKKLIKNKMNESVKVSYPMSVTKLTNNVNIKKGGELGMYTILKTFSSLTSSDINIGKFSDNGYTINKIPLKVGDKFNPRHNIFLFDIVQCDIVPCEIVNIVKVDANTSWEEKHYFVIFKIDSGIKYCTHIYEFLRMYTKKN